MVRSAFLGVLMAAAVQGQAPTITPDAAATQEKLLGTMISECIRDGERVFDFDPAETTTPPPGLSRLAGFKLHRLDGPLSAYVYKDFGSGHHEGGCGIAVYGNVSGQMLDDVRAMLKTMGWKKVDLRYYQIPGATRGEQEYWPREGSRWLPRTGVSIIERAPSTLAPTIEVHFHDTPVS